MAVDIKDIHALLLRMRNSEYDVAHYGTMVKYCKPGLLETSHRHHARAQQMYLAEVTELYRVVQEKYVEVAGEIMR